MNNPYCKVFPSPLPPVDSSIIEESSVIEEDSSVIEESSVVEESSIIESITKFGAHIESDTMDLNDRIAQYNKLGVTYIRENIIAGNTFLSSINAYTTAGLKLILNVTASPTTYGNPVPFTTDLVQLESDLNASFDALDEFPEVVVCENEEFNDQLHDQDQAAYIDELTVFANVVHARNGKVTNGGVYGNVFHALVYRWLKTVNMTDATNFANVVFTNFVKTQIDTFSNSALEADIAEMQNSLNAYASLVDYINWHHYEVQNPNVDPAIQTQTALNVIRDVQRYVNEVYGLPLIVNETSIRNNAQPLLVTGLLTDYDLNNVPYVLYFVNIAGNIFGGTEFYNDVSPWDLNDMGNAFKNYMMMP